MFLICITKLSLCYTPVYTEVFAWCEIHGKIYDYQPPPWAESLKVVPKSRAKVAVYLASFLFLFIYFLRVSNRYWYLVLLLVHVTDRMPVQWYQSMTFWKCVVVFVAYYDSYTNSLLEATRSP